MVAGTTRVAEPLTHRLLSTAYIDEPAIAPLYDDQDEKAILDALEAMTSTRLAREARGPDMLTPAFGYGWTFVNAAFVYTRMGGSRFNDEERGAWYASLAVETALAEVAFHLGRELRATAETENRTDYVQLIAAVEGDMVDLRGFPGDPCLDPDPAVGYPAGQALAARARSRDLAGIVYPAVRAAGGTNLACLTPRAIGSVSRGARFSLTWAGGNGPVVERAEPA